MSVKVRSATGMRKRPPRQEPNIFHDLLFDQAEVRLMSGVLYHLRSF
jgi:hypothetical protein